MASAITIQAIAAPMPPLAGETVSDKEKWVPAPIAATGSNVAFTPLTTEVSF